MENNPNYRFCEYCQAYFHRSSMAKHNSSNRHIENVHLLKNSNVVVTEPQNNSILDIPVEDATPTLFPTILNQRNIRRPDYGDELVRQRYYRNLERLFTSDSVVHLIKNTQSSVYYEVSSL